MAATFQSFLQSSFELSSSTSSDKDHGPTLQQTAALAAYTKAAILAQMQQKVFTPTIYSQIASMVLTQTHPAVFYAGKFYPLKDDTTNNVNDETISNCDNDAEGTKVHDSSTGSEDCTLDTTAAAETSFRKVPNENITPSSSISLKSSSLMNESTLTSTPSPLPSSTKGKRRERKLPSRYASNDIVLNNDEQEDEEENIVPGATVAVDEEDEYSSGDDDDMPVLEKFDSSPLQPQKPSQKSLQKNDSLIGEATTSSDGFKHPKKAIKYDRVDGPQLLPNLPLSCFNDLIEQTQPLEEWFLSNLTNPFPTNQQFSKLQYASNIGHLDIRSWFKSRRGYFCKHNPKSRPWAKKSVSTKRLSSSDDENGKGKSVSNEIVAKKIKTMKLEISELEA